MRAAVISDIHGNLPALEAVLAQAGSYDELWCIGDVVGLGPWPNECVALLRELGATGVMGNHDLGAVGRPGPEFESEMLLAESNPWTRSLLSPASLEWLQALPERLTLGDVTLLHNVAGHGSRAQRQEDFAGFTTPHALIGHFHLPHALRRDGRWIVNPGAVGAPDWHPGHSAYAIFANGELEPHELPFDPAEGLEEARRRGAPPHVMALWQRHTAEAMRLRGDLAGARSTYERMDTRPSGRQEGFLLEGLAALAVEEGDLQEAKGLLARVEGDHPVLRYRIERTAARIA